MEPQGGICGDDFFRAFLFHNTKQYLYSRLDMPLSRGGESEQKVVYSKRTCALTNAVLGPTVLYGGRRIANRGHERIVNWKFTMVNKYLHALQLHRHSLAANHFLLGVTKDEGGNVLRSADFLLKRLY